jgi:tRNA(Ile)-lysidine synthase
MMETGRKTNRSEGRRVRQRAVGRVARRSLSGFARRLLEEWKRLRLPDAEGERVVVAVSGGADSTALLLALDELIKSERIVLRLTVAHLDHELRGEEGRADARWVSELAESLGHEVALERVSVKALAEEERDNLEQSARRARYQFLLETAAGAKCRHVLTAHTMDDQAETMLLRLLRGSGADGLSGIEPLRALAPESDVLLVRPLVRWARRAETEEYCRERGVDFRVDGMNLDERFARVRVRKSLLPLMRSFNARIVEALSRTSELLREDGQALDAAAAKLLDEASEGAASDAEPLRVDVLVKAPAALRRRALRQWIARGRGDLRRLELVHLTAVENLLFGERGGRRALLPGGASVSRKQGRLWFSR